MITKRAKPNPTKAMPKKNCPARSTNANGIDLVNTSPIPSLRQSRVRSSQLICDTIPFSINMKNQDLKIFTKRKRLIPSITKVPRNLVEPIIKTNNSKYRIYLNLQIRLEKFKSFCHSY